MTNKEYLVSVLGRFGFLPGDFDLILLGSGLNGNDEATDLKALQVAIHGQIPLMLAGMQNVSEGGYSIRWNFDAIKAWYSWLSKRLGLPDDLNPTPTVIGVKPW